MNTTELRLKISTPTEPIVPGRGFYQLEEESLYVQVAPFLSNRRFFSYLESESVRLDIDRTGRLLFIEVAVPRRNWIETDPLPCPDKSQPADIRFLNFRQEIPQPELLTDRYRTHLLLRFGDLAEVVWYDPAAGVSIAVGQNDSLGAVWIDSITDDLAGRQISAHRKRVRRSLKSIG